MDTDLGASLGVRLVPGRLGLASGRLVIHSSAIGASVRQARIDTNPVHNRLI